MIGLLESSAARVKEVWLPGRWTERLADLCRDPADFLIELAHDVGRTEPQGARPPSLDDIAAEDTVPAEVEEISTAVEGLPDALEMPDSVDDDMLWEHIAHFPGPWPGAGIGSGRVPLWIEAVQAAKRIRDLAKAAHHHGASIRWFDHEEAQRRAPAGGTSFLKPLNSVEIKKSFARQKLGALRFLALSVSNRESLVFCAPAGNGESAVLFSADSDLSFDVSNAFGVTTTVVTAPHHGSEANAAAYKQVSQNPPSSTALWVRSDGHFRARPGASFLGLPPKQRFCTTCRGAARGKSAIRFSDSAAGWQPTTGMVACCCV